MSDKKMTHLQRAKDVVVQHFLPLSFAIAIILAMAWPTPGKAVVSVQILGDVHLFQEISMMIVFFISGLVLKTEDLKRAWAHKLGIVYGFVAIMAVTPMLGFLFPKIPLEPREFSIGLVMYSLVPTTLGVGIALVRSCKGNEGVALLLTVGTNILGVATMPFLVKLLLHDVKGVRLRLDVLDLFIKLMITILVPSVIGKVAREMSKAVQAFTTRHKVFLSLFSTFNLAAIIWQTLSAAQATLIKQSFVQLVCVILLAAGQHLLYLLINHIITLYVFRMAIPEAVATTIMSSQKSAPVAVTVISYIAKGASTQGLIIIPPIIGQILQIFIGSALAPWFAKQIEASEEQQQTSKDKDVEGNRPAEEKGEQPTANAAAVQ